MAGLCSPENVLIGSASLMFGGWSKFGGSHRSCRRQVPGNLSRSSVRRRRAAVAFRCQELPGCSTPARSTYSGVPGQELEKTTRNLSARALAVYIS